MISGGIGSFVLLTVLSVSYSAAIVGSERLRLAVTAGRVPTMTSVWALAGVVTLPAWSVPMLLMVLFGADWPARRITAAAHPWRYAYSCATSALTAYLAALAFHSLPLAIGLLAAVAVFTAGTIGAASVAIVAARQWVVLKMFLSPRSHMVELATQALGAIAGSAVTLHQPLLAVLILPALAYLHRAVARRDAEDSGTFDEQTGLWREDAWRVQAADMISRGRHVAMILLHPARPGCERMIASVLRTCLRPSDPKGTWADGGIVAAVPVRTAGGGRLAAQDIRNRLAELNIPCAVGSATAAGGDVSELLVLAGADLMARRRTDRPVLDH